MSRSANACDAEKLLELCALARLTATKALEYYRREVSYQFLLIELSGQIPDPAELARKAFLEAIQRPPRPQSSRENTVKNIFQKKPTVATTEPTEEAARLLDEVGRIQTAIALSEQELSGVESVLATARKDCGQIEADVALGAASDIDAYAPVRVAQEGVERVRIKLEALRARLASRVADLQALEGPLSQIEGEISSRYRAAWLESFREKAAALRTCLAEGVAIDTVFKLDLAPHIVQAKMADPEVYMSNLLGIQGFDFAPSAVEMHAMALEDVRVIRRARAAASKKEEVPPLPDQNVSGLIGAWKVG